MAGAMLYGAADKAYIHLHCIDNSADVSIAGALTVYLITIFTKQLS